ncbi:hypothetical protein CSC94_16170 [Zhengella mangrovi]|uniref:Uncharacterized protein n=2 Tax=Zhengella mangrovi TaxID=1982044 RepID=A0A2G1QKZ7_9HYPH|nr:hypothetical protein CSC94_16170 [Zhengella mangrovi]
MILLSATVLGPPIGGFLLGLAMSAFRFVLLIAFLIFNVDVPEHAALKPSVALEMATVPIFLAYSSYAVAGIPAFLSGLVVAIHASFGERLTFGTCALHVLWIMAAYLLFTGGIPDVRFLGGWLVAYILLAIPALIATSVLLRFFRPYLTIAKPAGTGQETVHDRP